MGKIVSIKQSVQVTKQLHKQGNSIVLAGGCFDILHVGHVTFLKKAKEKGDVLIVLLESDSSVRRLKGIGRPINTQRDRAHVLSALSFVNYVVLIPKVLGDTEYDELVKKIYPTILATTKSDPMRHHKERQAKLVKGNVLDITERLHDRSTTRLAKLLKEDFL